MMPTYRDLDCHSFGLLSAGLRSVYTMPCAIMALATFINPAMLAPFT